VPKSFYLPVAALLGLLASIVPNLNSARAEGKATRTDIMPVDQIKRGMKGYGLTVFEGTTPEKFGVEVIDVLDNFQPQQELILIKTEHPRLDVAKVVAGMSGSPIFIDGKMIGAYAYGWTFGREPVAGVTPIRSMLDDLARPLPKQIDGIPFGTLPRPRPVAQSGSRGKRAVTGSLYHGERGSYDVTRHAHQLADAKSKLLGTAPGAIMPVSTPLLMGGMTARSVGWAKDLLAPLGLEPLQAGGGGKSDPDAPKRFVDGGAVGISLIRGDISATGLGTVTRVEGDKLVAFGHPMMNSGVTNLPTAIGRILWFLASDMRSFKIGMPVRDIGAMVNDRQSSIVVSHSVEAPVIPVKLIVKGAPGAPYTDWNFEIAHEKFMTPAFMAVALGNAMQATAAERQDVSWTVKSRLEVKDHGVIQLEDQGVALGGTPDEREFAESPLVKAAGAILNNPWEPAVLLSAQVEIELRYERDILRLRGADLIETEIDAGEPARVRLTLEPYSGKAITRVVSIPIPRQLAGETVSITLEPGYNVEYDSAAPESVGELVQNLEHQSYPAKSVVASFATGDSAVSFKGRIAKNLPPGALDSIQPVTTSVAPDTFGTQVRRVFTIGQFMTGQDSVSVKIRPVLR
jgi:hypothetical protein